MTGRLLAKLIAAILALTAAISVAMLQVDWTGVAASEEADLIDTLLDVMIVLSSFVFSVVLVMLGYCVWRFRARPGDERDGEPILGNTPLEVAWTAIPTLIILFAIGYSWIVLDSLEEREPDRLRVTVTARQFTWTFEYPGTGLNSSVLHVPVGRQVEFRLRTLDVIHGFWVPEWRIKRDAVVQPGAPGQDAVDDTVVVTPDHEGRYTVVCAELCGVGHATMRNPVVVESEREFERWLERQETRPRAAPA
ncbi:MAG: cytochrome c oxidase subunit II [Solirubrobacterales bacterium]